MASPIRLRKLARELGRDEHELAHWIGERFGLLPEPHPADFLREEVATTARRELPKAEPEPDPPATVAAGRLLVEAFASKGYRRLVIVGGSPASSKELRRILEPAIELKIVDGDGARRPDNKRAAAEVAWADIVAIWTGTILTHKMSIVYTRWRAAYAHKFVTIPSGGAGSFCRYVSETLREQTPR